ncbi:MAG TPA: hypothetical protein VIH88_11795 [Candidatus Acidoferrales bacterium]
MVLLVTFVTVCNAAGPNAQKKREAAYQATLLSYSDLLKPGMTRKYVEDYLRSKGAIVQQLCCVEEKSALADLLKVGTQKHPWYCEEHNVYIAFQFVAIEPHKPWEAYDSDTLKSIAIFHRPEGCL